MKISASIALVVDHLKERVGFTRFEISIPSPEVEAVLAQLPEVGHLCRVRLNKNKTGSAYSSMWEYAAVAGYTETADGLKAMVVFTERESADKDHDWAFVPVAALMPYKAERVKEFKL